MRAVWRFGLRVLGAGAGLVLAAAAAPDAAAPFNPSNATLEELVGWTQVYVSTPARKQARDGARAELARRGGESLRFLMARYGGTNESIHQLAYDLVVFKLASSNSAPVLLEFLEAPDGSTRKAAAYFLGFTTATNAAERLLPLLADEPAAGAAARTLGKWRAREARAGVEALLRSDKEPRRVIAVNALRDLGDPDGVPALLRALEDPVFTVRKAAARALVALGKPAETGLLEALPASSGPAQREIVRALGALRVKRATRPLRALQESATGALRDDIAAALVQIEAGGPKR